MAMTIAIFSNLLTDSGLGRAIVQHASLTSDHLNAAVAVELLHTCARHDYGGQLILMSGGLRGADTDVDLDARAFSPGLLFTATHH